MSVQSIFLREIDTERGAIEVLRVADSQHTDVVFGPFHWLVDDADHRAVINLLGRVTAEPCRDYPPLVLATGAEIHIGATHGVQSDPAASNAHQPIYVWISANGCYARLVLGAAALVLAALCEAHGWHQRSQLFTRRAAPC